MTEKTPKFTRGSYATSVAHVASRATLELQSLAHGMWNPDFCSANANDWAGHFCNDLEDAIREIRRRMRAAKK